jgi:hypothetical protein
MLDSGECSLSGLGRSTRVPIKLGLGMIHAAVVTASPWSARSARSTAKLTMRAVTGGEVEEDALVEATQARQQAVVEFGRHLRHDRRSGVAVWRVPRRVRAGRGGRPAPGVGARGCLRERVGRRPAAHLVRLRRIGRATAVWVDAFLDAARGRSRTGPGGRPAY